MDQASVRNKRLKCCDSILTYGFLISGLNLFQRSYFSSNIGAQFSTLSKSEDPLASYLRWLIYTNSGRLLMMDVFCIVFSFLYLIMKIFIQYYFPSKSNFLYRLIFATPNPGRIHFLFTKIYCSRFFLTSQFDCYLITLTLIVYLLCIGAANLIENETNRILQQIHSSSNASSLERAKAQIDSLAKKTNKAYPLLLGLLSTLFLSSLFLFFQLDALKLFLFTYPFLCAICHVVVNA